MRKKKKINTQLYVVEFSTKDLSLEMIWLNSTILIIMLKEHSSVSPMNLAMSTSQSKEAQPANQRPKFQSQATLNRSI